MNNDNNNDITTINLKDNNYANNGNNTTILNYNDDNYHINDNFVTLSTLPP